MRLSLIGLFLALPLLAACSTPAAPAPTPQATRQATTPSASPAARKQYASAPPMTIDRTKQYFAVLHTTDGTIRVHLFASEDPVTVNNFVFLARDHFYDGVKFHRIIKGFMVQTGDPLGTGAGGPGYRFQDETVTRDYKPGIVAMANSGPNTNGSQFFIMHGDYSGRLPKNYSIFGKVVQGMETVNKIATAETTMGGDGAMSKPLKPVKIVSVKIERVGGGKAAKR